MRVKRELLRLTPVLALGGLFLAPDISDLKTVLFSLSIIALIIYLSHIIRKTMFPYLDLEVHMDRALDTPMAASIVFASIIYLISVIIQSAVAFLR